MPENRHIEELVASLRFLDTDRLEAWGRDLASVLSSGRRLLVAGNGGSAAQAQHLTAELVGRFSQNRDPLSAVSLHADSSTVTAVGNDFGFNEVYSRQVRAHGRPGDVLLVLSTSGQSPNLVQAVTAAKATRMRTWALTGPAPNPLAAACDEFLAVTAASAATVQECHLVSIHLLCRALDAVLVGTTAPGQGRRSPRPPRRGRLVIIGDALLDKDVSGDADRVSPEAPVPVVSSVSEHVAAGGAGRAAILAAEAGHAVTLITALADDADAATLSELLARAGVRVSNLGTQSATAVKVRVRSRGQTIVMIDRSAPPALPGAVTREAQEVVAAADAVVVSDYGRGVAADDAVRGLLTAAARRVPVVWDPHPLGAVPVARTRLVTPNDREARGFAPAVRRDGLPGAGARARHLRFLWEATGVAVTRGENGAVLVCGDDPPLAFSVPVPSSGDSRGAGDMFAVTAAASLGQGMVLSDAVATAVAAASAYVASADRPAAGQAPAGDWQDALTLAARVRASGGVVVATGGCFDLLHRGHISQLAGARRLGDCLIVCLNSDASAKRLKGDGRPVVPAEDRMAVLSALACVDAVIVFDEDTPAEVLRSIRPHLWVKGGDYAIADMPERAVVEEAGGEVVLVPYVDGRSSTGLIERAAAAHEVTGNAGG